MNTTTITVDGQEVTLKFGIWTLARLVDRGYKMTDLANAINDNPFDFIPTLIYLGACNAKGMNLEAFELAQFYDYIDTVGFSSKEVTKVISCFTNSISQDVPGQKKRPQTVKAK
jgi:hypothetical protein